VKTQDNLIRHDFKISLVEHERNWDTADTFNAHSTLPMLEQNGGINLSGEIYMMRYGGAQSVR